MGEVNLQNFNTETQWLPKLEYTRLGDSFLNDWVNVSMRSGIDYANTHEDVCVVDNKNIFAILPLRPGLEHQRRPQHGSGLLGRRGRRAAEPVPRPAATCALHRGLGHSA